METKGYTLYDITDQYTDYPYIQSALIAQSSDKNHQIEFYILSTADDATNFYNKNKAKFESAKATTAVESSVNVNNYSKYELTTNGYYQVVSRIDNTVIYLDVDSTYTDTVKDVLESLGY